jgi:hypothetical protein
MAAKGKITKATPDSLGVVLFAFGNRVYYWAAYNLAWSIRHYSPEVGITVFIDSTANVGKWCHELLDIADKVIEVDKELLFTNGKFDPGKLKVSLYDLLPYSHNLYLDVDAVCLKDINPLFTELMDSKKNYISHTVGYHTIDKGREIPSMQWAWATDIWEHFKLDSKSMLPAINSSLQFIVKSAECEQLYNTAKDLYINNPLPLNKLRMKWGGGQPDELYMNVSCAINKIDPAIDVNNKNEYSESGHIHFAMRRGLTIDEVIRQYYFQSYYGGRGFTARFYTEWLDRKLYNMMQGNHQYKIDMITRNKHADKK